MNKVGIAVGIAVAVTLVVGGLVWSKEKDRERKDGDQQMVAMAAVAPVTIEQAMKTAVEKFPGRVVEAELEKHHDKTVWDIKILTAAHGIMGLHIDAVSGAVIDSEEKIAGKKTEPVAKQEPQGSKKP